MAETIPSLTDDSRIVLCAIVCECNERITVRWLYRYHQRSLHAEPSAEMSSTDTRFPHARWGESRRSSRFPGNDTPRWAYARILRAPREALAKALEHHGRSSSV